MKREQIARERARQRRHAPFAAALRRAAAATALLAGAFRRAAAACVERQRCAMARRQVPDTFQDIKEQQRRGGATRLPGLPRPPAAQRARRAGKGQEAERSVAAARTRGHQHPAEGRRENVLSFIRLQVQRYEPAHREQRNTSAGKVKSQAGHVGFSENRRRGIGSTQVAPRTPE